MPGDIRELLERECDFPIDHDTLVERIGDARLDPPNGDPRSLASVLERCGESTYRTAEEAHSAIAANLGDDHVGRKHYDDRSDVVFRDGEVSF